MLNDPPALLGARNSLRVVRHQHLVALSMSFYIECEMTFMTTMFVLIHQIHRCHNSGEFGVPVFAPRRAFIAITVGSETTLYSRHSGDIYYLYLALPTVEQRADPG